MDRLLILGTRKFASEVAQIAGDAGYEVVGYVENLDRERCRATKDDLPVYWIDDVGTLAPDHAAVCALATTHRSRFVEEAAARGLRFASVAHPTAIVLGKSRVGRGVILNVMSIVASHARIGNHVLLNRGALIGHHTSIGDYSTVGPGTNIAGSCAVGTGVYFGMSAVVLDNLTIGDRSVIAAGAVVTRDVEAHTMVAGIPARVLKRGIEGK